MHNNLGRFYRQISKLDRAVEHLRQALDLAIKSGNLRQAASTRNNLAATLRIIGELDEANAMCRAAIAELKKLGQNTPLAYAYLTKADIDRDKGSPRNAERAAKQALTMFKEVNEIAGQAQAYRTLASIERLLQRFDNAKSYLQQATNLIEGKEGVKPILASLYQVYGRTYRHHATYLQDFPNAENEGQEKELLQEALTYLDKSIELGNEIGNLWEVARSQLEIVLIKMLSQESLATNELNANLNEVEEIALQIEDNLLLGYVYENRGRIALRKGNYRAAGRAFGEAAQFIVQCKGQEGDRAIDRLYDILLDSDLENEQSDALAEGILERLDKKSISTYKALKGLETMCKQILGVATI